MDADTLASAMGCDRAVADRYVGDFNAAMIAAGATTVDRAAMFCAQVGHESGGLRWMEEIWGPTPAQKRYEGRRDLGNTVPGDGARFKGRGPIQLTGRNNYAAFGRWCASRGLAAADAFLREPTLVATGRWGVLAAAYFWVVARDTRLNAAADRRDVTGATRLINGGTNGLGDRVVRHTRCLKLGRALLPTTEDVARPTAPARPVSGPAGFRAAYGDVGVHIFRLAAFLNGKFPLYSALPLEKNPADQRYGDRTKEVILEFAQRSRISADGGNVGPQIAQALVRAGFGG